VAPAELEGHLLGHPDVQDACVVGVTDEYSGELPLAFVALQPKASRRAKISLREADALKHSIKKHVSDHKIKYKGLDGGVVFVDAIPKNPSGKILVCLPIDVNVFADQVIFNSAGFLRPMHRSIRIKWTLRK
jgi:4-coumarate--CoA ligase